MVIFKYLNVLYNLKNFKINGLPVGVIEISSKKENEIYISVDKKYHNDIIKKIWKHFKKKKRHNICLIDIDKIRKGIIKK